MSSIEGDEEDLTRKQRREQARAERKAMEEAAASSAVRRTRMTQLGIVVAVVVVAIVVILVATSGGGKTGLKKGTEATAVTHTVNTLLNGIPQTGTSLGSPTAPVTLKYFGDLECPICQEFTLGALPELITKYVREGKLRIEYHSMQTATREPEVFLTQQVAAGAAGKQSKGWNFIETFYHEQGEEDSGYVNEHYLQGIASQIPGLNVARWETDRKNPELADQVETDKQVANNEGFTGTPSFLIGKTGGGTEKVTELTDADLKEAQALFGPKVEKLASS